MTPVPDCLNVSLNWQISHSVLSRLLLLGTAIGDKIFTNLLFFNSLWEWFTSVSSGRTLFPGRYCLKPIDGRKHSPLATSESPLDHRSSILFDRILGTIASLGTGVDEHEWLGKVSQNVIMCVFFLVDDFCRAPYIHHWHFTTLAKKHNFLSEGIMQLLCIGRMQYMPSATCIVRILVSILSVFNGVPSLSQRTLP